MSHLALLPADLLTLPVTTATVRLVFERPLQFERREGATLMTSLRGLLMRHVVDAACRLAGSCERGDVRTCRMPGTCEADWFLRPRSVAQKRDHVPPVGIHLLDVSVESFGVEIVLWGRRACAAQLAVWLGLAQAGLTGLKDARGLARFRVLGDAWRSEPVEAIVPARLPHALWAVLSGLEDQSARELPVMFANAAHDVTQFSLADSGRDVQLGKRGCDEVADHVRAAVREALAVASIEWRDAEHHVLGERTSFRNRQRFNLAGYNGTVRVEGLPATMAPWLALATRWGIGGRKSFGLGRLEFRDDAGLPWPA